MTLPGFIRRNFKLKVGCTIMALITWTGVVYASNPPETRLVSVPVPQSQASFPSKFTLVHHVPDLAVRIGGSRSSLDAFNPASLTVNVDWHNVSRAGLQQVPISITNVASNVELVDPPQSITADVDYYDSVSLPVNLVVTNPPPAGYTIASQSVAPSTVVVAGPHLELTDIQARVSVDLGNNKTNYVQIAPVLIYDAHSNRLNDLSVTSPPGFTSNAPQGTVTVTIVVSANLTSRAAAVRPPTTGNPAPGHQLSAITVSPATVVLTGPQTLLNTLDWVSTSSISLNGLTGSETVTVNVTPPAGVTSSPTSVAVTVFITALPTPTPTASSSP
ncbi:MAG: hypothetical protein JO198_03390 [Candidatus Dormibacteraeota bacterium]|nr:hypothetical protein [Candidatus Dormibacteraeota bacterium]